MNAQMPSNKNTKTGNAAPAHIRFLILLYRMTNNRLQLFRSHFTGITQIDLMMQSFICNVQFITFRRSILMHKFYRGWLIIIGADMHTLYAQTFIVSQKLDL